MSMTTEQRKAWAYENLERYLRDVEISEFMDAIGDVSHLEDRVCDLENMTEDLNQQTEMIRDNLDAVSDTADSAHERLDELTEQTA